MIFWGLEVWPGPYNSNLFKYLFDRWMDCFGIFRFTSAASFSWIGVLALELLDEGQHNNDYSTIEDFGRMQVTYI